MAATQTFRGIAANNNISAATVVKSTAGRVCRVAVTTAGTTTGSVYDFAASTGETAAQLCAIIPMATGVYEIDWPCETGILIVPGTGQVVSVTFT